MGASSEDDVGSFVSAASGGKSPSFISSIGSASSAESIDLNLVDQISSGSWLRSTIYDITQSSTFSNFILIVILANTICLSLETVKVIRKAFGWYLTIADCCFLGVYILECALKLFSWRLRYFKSAWNLFDFIIVIVSIITWIIPYYLTSAISFNVRIFRLLRIFRAVKAFRSIRVLRAISFLRSLQIIISTVLKSIPAMGNIVLMAGLFLYMFAIIGTVCYRDIDSRRFGGLGPSLFRLFQMMTLDHWSEIYKQNENQSWSMYYFVVIVIIVECFIFLNLFVAVIVNNLQSSRDKLNVKRRKKKKEGDDYLFGDQFGISQSTLSSKTSDHLLDDGIFEGDIGVDNYYSPNLPSTTKGLFSQYFMLLASLELNQLMYQKQQKVLDDLVDLSKEK